MSIQITGLTFEHHRDSLGIGEAQPRLSWSYQGTASDWVQSSYEIEVQRGDATVSRIETYTVNSDDCVLVPWPSSPLQSGESVSVRVRAFGNASETAWTNPQQVEAGLLQPDDWTCSLIETTCEIESTKPHPPTLFRRRFQVKKHHHKARLYITSHGVYEAEINGVKVSDHILAPGWTVYNHELPYQTFDVTHLLQTNSENVIAVHVAEGWYCGRLGFEGGRHNIWGSRLGLIAQLVITYEDGTPQVVVTDSSWKYSSSPILNASIYDGETYDMSKDQPGWSCPEFDDGTWSDVHVTEHDLKLLRAPDGPPIRATESLPVTNVIKSPSGKTILDFGQNLVGWVRFRVPKGPPQHQISLIHTEVLEHGECATRPLRLAKVTDTLILTDKPSSPDTGNKQRYWQPRFTFHGFRYVELNNWPQEMIDSSDFSAIVIHTDMKATGTFECSDPLLNRLHQNVIWSMRGNFVGIPTDCPQRDERLGWTGDIQAFASTASFLYDCQGMLRSWLRNLAFEQQAGGNGAPPFFSPNVMAIPTIPMAIWGDATVLVPWDLYTASSDVELLRSQFESMQYWVDKGIPRDADNLWGYTMAQLGDWLDPTAPPDRPGHGSTDAYLVANAFLIRSTDVMSQVSHILGHEDKAQSYARQATALRTAFVAEYITSNGRLASDSQAAIALAIQFNLFPESEQRAHAAERLDHLIRVRTRFRIGTGFAGTPILGHALTKVGKTELFYRMLMNTKTPSWLYPVTMGATTVWERWNSMLPDGTINPGEMTSFNHYALGAVADWMHTVIGGLSPLRPGWKHFRVAPIPGGRLTSASVSFDSPCGMIRSRWVIESSQAILTVEVPPNTTAEIVFLSEDVQTVGSGTHEFRRDYVEPVRPALPAPLPFTTEDDDAHSLT